MTSQNRLARWSACLLVLFLWASAPVHASETVTVTQRHGQSLRGTVEGFPFLLLRGSHGARGEAHGVLAAREVLRSCDGMARFVNAHGGGWDRALVAMRRFEFPPRFEQELAGMLRGIRTALPERDDRVLSATGKEIALDDLKLLQTGDVFELARCSQFSAWSDLTPDRRIVVGRNWDYPDLFPRETCCLLAVQPTEPGLRPTLDAMWFGMIGSGLATIREDGLYVSANSGGRVRPGVTVKHPTPGALLMRAYAESAAAAQLGRQLIQAVDQKLVLPIIFHVVPPGGVAGDCTPFAVEYTPDPDRFGARVRSPSQDAPTSLSIANHFIDTPEDLDRWRSGRMRAGIQSCAVGKKPIGFEEARAILDAAKQDSTYYSAVVWPEQRRMRLAVSAPGIPATQRDYLAVRWEDLFALR
jgi:hypothetical protein